MDIGKNGFVGQNLIAQGHVMSNNGGHILAAKKNFDIPHPTKEGWRLRHFVQKVPQMMFIFEDRYK